MQTRGKYIVIEGNDGVGKSTQAALVREKLADIGIESTLLHEPGSAAIGSEIQKLLKNGRIPRDEKTNLLLFTASRREGWLNVQEALERGVWVVAERNYFSTLAYQGYGKGIDRDFIVDLTRDFTDESYLHPDLAVILTLKDRHERARRIADRDKLSPPDAFESRDEAFQTAVEQGYLAIAEEYDLPVISASQSKEIIISEIYTYIAKLI